MFFQAKWFSLNAAVYLCYTTSIESFVVPKESLTFLRQRSSIVLTVV